MNIISYVIFDRNRVDENRWYDPHANDKRRYWYNIPMMALANDLVLPELRTKVYIQQNVKANPLIDFMLKASERLPRFDIQHFNWGRVNTEATMCRLFPIWEKDVEFLFCRDIDSVINAKEVRAMKVYLKTTDYAIQTMRTHPEHNALPMFAGLCGFNVPVLKKKTPIVKSFYEYSKIGHRFGISKFGIDQSVMGWYFVDSRNPCWQPNILDTRVQCFADPVVPFKQYNFSSFPQEKYDTYPLECDNEMLAICDRLTVWPGEPVDSRGKFLNEALSLNRDSGRIIREIIEGNPKLKDYYGL